MTINEALHIAQQPIGSPPDAAPKDGIDFRGGLIAAPVHGRTDKIPLNIPSGSYVLPADIVSAMGQGNTIAGAKMIQEVMKGAPYGAASGGPYGSNAVSMKRGSGVAIPDAPKGSASMSAEVPTPHMARGGGGKLVRAAGLMIVNQVEHTVLFIRRSGGGDHGGEWCFPGGHVEPGETPEQAARRETQEEIGVPVRTPVVPWTHRTADGVDFVTFLARVGRSFQPRLNGEHTHWTWAHFTRPPQPLHPGCRVALNRLAGGPAKEGGVRPGGNAPLVPIIAAGGEYVLLPHECAFVGGGDTTKGHRMLDQFVVATREQLRKTLAKLKPPKQN